MKNRVMIALLSWRITQHTKQIHISKHECIIVSVVNTKHNSLVEAHCYGKGMTGQFLSRHVAVKQIEGI